MRKEKMCLAFFKSSANDLAARTVSTTTPPNRVSAPGRASAGMEGPSRVNLRVGPFSIPVSFYENQNARSQLSPTVVVRGTLQLLCCERP